jgi:hypothetical protein
MRRRWLQFSLRGFLVAMTLFAVWLGWVAERAMRQKEAVALLEAWGARIEYAHRWQGPHKPPKKAPPPGWSWLRKLLCPHFFDQVVSVELIAGGRLFTAAEEAAVRRGGAAPLPSRLLELTDRDFQALAHLPDLRRLHIVGDFHASEATTRRLGRLKKLETLILDNTSGRSVGGITDGALSFVERMPYLTELYLEGNPITDAGLANVRLPVGLTRLDLSGTRITDAGLEHLQSITTLRSVVVLDTRVTEAGVKKLQAALPNCRVYRLAWQSE